MQKGFHVIGSYSWREMPRERSKRFISTGRQEAILDAGRKGIDVLLPKAGKPTKLKAAKLISQDETVIDVDVDAE